MIYTTIFGETVESSEGIGYRDHYVEWSRPDGTFEVVANFGDDYDAAIRFLRTDKTERRLELWQKILADLSGNPIAVKGMLEVEA